MQGLSLRQLARVANVHFVSLARLEAGRFDPRLSTLRKLAKALNVTIAELVGEAKPSNKGGKSYGTH
jgi:transcriptional regulator with XRE-family HTH domain